LILLNVRDQRRLSCQQTRCPGARRGDEVEWGEWPVDKLEEDLFLAWEPIMGWVREPLRRSICDMQEACGRGFSISWHESRFCH
jgi:hypothetical protein